jgi:hypothetical protein
MLARGMLVRGSRGWVVVLLLLSAACDSLDAPRSDSPPFDEDTTPGGSGAGTMLQPPLGAAGSLTLPLPATRDDLGAACDPARGVAADGPGLIVRDPEVLAAFSLERSLQQLAASAGVTLSPEQLLQRLFDTENTTATGVFPDVQHCDDPENAAFRAAKAVDCPRAEGRLATSTGLFTEGDPDFFAPVALVNRFDLTPSDRSTCGEYRLVYAKQSGRSNPQDRVLLIIEAALFNASDSLSSCRPVAELWEGLSLLDSESQKARLSALYFDGVGRLAPVLSFAHLGDDGGDCRYSGRCGQIRIGQGMQAPFQFRQFRLRAMTGNLERANRLEILPAADSRSPRPQLWDLPSADLDAASFRQELVEAVPDLSKANPMLMSMHLSPSHDAGESAISGAARPNFAERLATSPAAEAASLTNALSQQLLEPNLACPSDDPLTPDAIVHRVTALTCAGCHAPEQLLPAGRKLGCGSVWPRSLGETHINELGELSPALTDVFLPHRAEVLSTFLQACDVEKVEANLQFVPSPPIRPECFPAGTLITLANGAHKPIEHVAPSEWVLAFDRATHALVPARVTQRVVRQDAQRFVRINDALVATDNHPFFTEAGWVRAVDLRVGVTLLSLTNAQVATALELGVETTRVARLTLEAGSGPTYNLHVEGQDNYFAGGVLVHDRP